MDNNEYFLRSWFAVADEALSPDKAMAVPDDLAGRILAGEHPLDIWMEHENVTLRLLATILHMPLKKISQQSQAAEPYFAFRGEDILIFCMRRGVHPAHLVPFDDSPQLSLPRCILEANIMMAQDRSETVRNRQLAEEAIAWEKKRYSRFLTHGRHGTGLSFMFAQAIADGHYDAVYRQLDAHSHDKRQESLNIAPLLLERLLLEKQKELDKLQGRRSNIDLELELADGELDRAYEAVFGHVPTDRYKIVTDYALSLRDRYPREMTDKQLSRNAYDVGAMSAIIYDLIAEDVTKMLAPYYDNPLDAVHDDILTLADKVRAYWQAQAKLDVFNEENGDKIEALELVSDYITQCMTLVSGGQGDVVRRIFVNYGVIKNRQELHKAQTTVCALLKPPAAE